MGFFSACSACEAGEAGWRVSLAVRASRRELPCRDAEDVGQSLYLCSGKTTLSAATVAFGGAYSGVGAPAHQFAELRLSPSLAMAQGSDVRADDGPLANRDLIDAPSPSRHHTALCQVTL
jgi:hypothetical protein